MQLNLTAAMAFQEFYCQSSMQITEGMKKKQRKRRVRERELDSVVALTNMLLCLGTLSALKRITSQPE